MDVHPPKNGIDRYWPIPIYVYMEFPAYFPFNQFWDWCSDLNSAIMKISGVSQFPSINAASTIDLMGFHGIYWTNNGIYNQHYGNFCVCVSKNRGLNNDIRPSYGYVDNKNWYKTGFGGTQFLYDWQTQLWNFNMYIYISLYIYMYVHIL